MSAVKHYKHTAAQKAATGYTDVFVVDYLEAVIRAETTDNTAAASVLDALALGDVVLQDAIIKVETAWAGPADLTATVSLGVVGTATALSAAFTLTTAGTGVAAGTSAASANQTSGHYVATGAVNLIATFTPDADSALDEFTAGKLRIYCNIIRNTTLLNAQA